jgi:Fur family ferric uptake transcriptional regulator
LQYVVVAKIRNKGIMSHQQQNFAKRIRQQGYRLTPQRQLILDTVCQAGGHATATEICRNVKRVAPAVNRATVYRTLNFFCQLRLLCSSEIAGKTVYEIADPVPHHHLVCRGCGHVAGLANHHFGELADHLLAEHQFEAELVHLTIPGLCADCQN